MTTILCPTRGGEASYPTQDRAIALAREQKADILFLYVSNVRFLDRFASPILVDIEKELDELGEFLLAMAQERAEKAGVKAETEIRHGVFRHVLKQVIREYQVTVVVMGSAAGATGVTTRPYLEELASWIRDETGAEVILVISSEEGASRPGGEDESGL